MVTVSAFASPIGALTLARGPRGLMRLALAGETPQSVAEDLRARLGAEVAEDAAALGDVHDQLGRYFAGELERSTSSSTGRSRPASVAPAARR